MSLLARHRIAIILALGVVFRVAQYLADRRPWLDETSLAANIEQKTFIGLFGPLAHAQLAPPGFLLIEWVAMRTLGDTCGALRLFPLLCGIASLFLLYRVARCCLRPRDVWIALGLFAVSDDLIFFSSELKQYSTDVAVCLACYLMGTAWASRPATISRTVALAVAGAAAVWFSHPSVFFLAGLGTVLIASAVAARDKKGALLASLVCLLWAASFAAVYAVALNQLGHQRSLWVFWNFAFPPMPPSSLWEATWLIRRLLYLFVNPLNFRTPLGSSLSILAALAFFLTGCVSLCRRDRTAFWMLTLPGLFALLASCLHMYPFHGRLVLFLLPSLFLLITEGAGWVRETIGRGVLWAALLATLFLYPSLDSLYHLDEPRDYVGPCPRGDRRPDELDPDWYPFRESLSHFRFKGRGIE